MYDTPRIVYLASISFTVDLCASSRVMRCTRWVGVYCYIQCK